MNLRKNLWASVLISALALTFTACSSDDNDSPEGPRQSKDTAISFKTSIGMTRAHDNVWEANDPVGVFMTNSLYTPIGKQNAHYQASFSTQWLLEAVDSSNRLYYPSDGSNVRFIAYYPYNASITALTDNYPIILGAQTATNAFDLLYYRDATNSGLFNEDSGSPAIAFKHQLSKIIINIKKDASASTANISNMGVTLKGMPTQADFSLSTGVISNPKTVSDITTAVATTTATYDRTHAAVIIPHTVLFTGRTFVFTYTGIYGDATEFTYTVPTLSEYSSGSAYTYNFSVISNEIKFDGVSITNWTSETPINGGNIN